MTDTEVRTALVQRAKDARWRNVVPRDDAERAALHEMVSRGWAHQAGFGEVFFVYWEAMPS